MKRQLSILTLLLGSLLALWANAPIASTALANQKHVLTLTNTPTPMPTSVSISSEHWLYLPVILRAANCHNYSQGPQLVSPIDGTTINTDSVLFSWDWNGPELVCGNQFRIMGFRDGQWMILGNTTSTSLEVSMPAEDYSGIWQWYVIVVNASGNEISPRSATVAFGIAPPTSFPYALLSQTTSSDNNCAGHYIQGLVTAPDGTPLAGITIQAVDQYGTWKSAVTKDKPLGEYDIPIPSDISSYQVMVVEGSQALSAEATVLHSEQLSQSPNACHILNWQQSTN